jgi:hypothetical protein
VLFFCCSVDVFLSTPFTRHEFFFSFSERIKRKKKKELGFFPVLFISYSERKRIFTDKTIKVVWQKQMQFVLSSHYISAIQSMIRNGRYLWSSEVISITICGGARFLLLHFNAPFESCFTKIVRFIRIYKMIIIFKTPRSSVGTVFVHYIFVFKNLMQDLYERLCLYKQHEMCRQIKFRYKGH